MQTFEIYFEQRRKGIPESHHYTNFLLYDARGEAKLELRFITPEAQIVKPEVYINKFVYGKSNLYDNYVGKVILLVGATGAGKSTLVNAMLNHIKGVKLEDNYRYELIKEAEDQDKSQTEYITSYTFHPDSSSQVKDTITIIDTPGFADTKGIEADKNVFKKVQDFFQLRDDFSINEVHLVGIVVPISRVRLDATEKYIYNQILSLFGNDVSKNVVLLVTHMDVSKEPKQGDRRKTKTERLQARLARGTASDEHSRRTTDDHTRDGKTKKRRDRKRGGFTQLLHLEKLLQEKRRERNETKEAIKRTLESIMVEFAKEMTQIHRLIAEANECLMRLYEIAMKKDSPDVIEYIDLLIEKEQIGFHLGCGGKLKHLHEIKRAAEYLKQIQNGRGVFPFDEILKKLDKKGIRLIRTQSIKI
ncbi:unnamed protein product [Darwinula stevensoni]|uniref:AIG1-type G domain-containing protein n=1 Tax=Darwinula stevensoni TaxID=69355 RepID=A0A7R8XAE0_9CRUS|nr:unnamed protein product [Darwinula stevensoni]CAG0885483.1 unnamed protein product [Darwinula stevensoni]